MTFCLRIQSQPYGLPASGGLGAANIRYFRRLAAAADRARSAAAGSSSAAGGAREGGAAAAGGANGADADAAADAAAAQPLLDPVRPQEPDDVEIAPGKPGLAPPPFAPGDLLRLSLAAVPSPGEARALFEAGARDAAAWADSVPGLRAAAAAAAVAASERAGGGGGG